MKVAYLIRAHHAPKLLERVVRRLAGPDVGVFLHISRSAEDPVYDEMVSRLQDVEGVHWLPRRRCRYGGFSLVEATLAGLDAIAEVDPLPRHTLLLSGQDYPLRSRTEIDAFLERAGERSFVHHGAIPSAGWRHERGGLDRVQRMYFERFRYKTRLLRVPFVTRRFPKGLRPYGGSAFWALAPEAVAYVERFVRENPNVVRFFRHTLIPDELFFQTVLLNSPLRETIVNEELHYVDWSGHTIHPATLGLEDLEPMLASGKLFARKFDPAETQVLDRLDEAAQAVERA
ncbi:MAG: beta-1,6-N-acetylglucosaminyltransferase [Actinomycetota bacterium]